MILFLVLYRCTSYGPVAQLRPSQLSEAVEPDTHQPAERVLARLARTREAGPAKPAPQPCQAKRLLPARAKRHAVGFPLPDRVRSKQQERQLYTGNRRRRYCRSFIQAMNFRLIRTHLPYMKRPGRPFLSFPSPAATIALGSHPTQTCKRFAGTPPAATPATRDRAAVPGGARGGGGSIPEIRSPIR